MEIFQAAVLPVLDAEKETCARAERENPDDLDVSATHRMFTR
jgi:hypothetical protein